MSEGCDDGEQPGLHLGVIRVGLALLALMSVAFAFFTMTVIGDL